MDRTERFHIIDQLLSNQRFVTRAQFLLALEVSAATFKRDLEYLRDRLAAPIVWDLEQRAYCYSDKEAGADQYQLPGLWFSTSEVQALLTMDALLENLQPGMLSSHIKPLRSRIRMLLDKGDHSVAEISHRIRIIPAAAKKYKTDHFQSICKALLDRKRLTIEYFSRLNDSTSLRDISPQRLIYYRDNWYLDSWCHLRNGLRSFALDAIKSVKISTLAARDIDEQFLNNELESGYGIFSGGSVEFALLRFNPGIARWVAHEQWHAQQQSYFDTAGYYYLKLPYSQDTELLMDILRHGAEVEVLEPESLRVSHKNRIRAMQQVYST